jgi:hypothetical protein
MTDDPRILVMRVPGKEYVLVAYASKPDNAEASVKLYQSYSEMDRTKDRFLFRLDRCHVSGLWGFAEHSTLLGPIIFDADRRAPCPFVVSDALALAKHTIYWFENDFDEIISRYGTVTLGGVNGKLFDVKVSEQRGPNL